MLDITTFLLVSLIAQNHSDVKHNATEALYALARTNNVEASLIWYGKVHPSLDVRRECANVGDTYFPSFVKLPLITSFRHITEKELNALGYDPNVDKKMNEYWFRSMSGYYITQRLLDGESWDVLRWEIRDALENPEDNIND